MQKLISRKFLVTVAALLALLEGKNLDTAHLLVIGLVAAAYVIAEAVLDHAGLPAKEIVTNITNHLGGVLSDEGKAALEEAVGVASAADDAATIKWAATVDERTAEPSPRTLRDFPEIPPPPVMPNRTEAP